VETPYGNPSAPVGIAEIGGKKVAFLPRRGAEEEIPPHKIPYRANVWALKEIGVRRIVAPIVCGSLRLDLELGTFVVCDQFVDLTRGRADTFYEGPGTTLVSAAEHFCADLTHTIVETARELGIPVLNGGTAVVIQGPRFSTQAESRWFQQMGWDTVNMITYPECHLARELELCYANVSVVTDLRRRHRGRRSCVGFQRGPRADREARAAAGAPPRRDPANRPSAGGHLRDRA
jgi:5'-methylthioadenosine phosphorylase